MPSMASLTSRELKDGTTVWRVKFRPGGGADTKEVVETFNPTTGPHREFDDAEAFKKAVEAFGGNWPPNWVPGVGYLTLRQFQAQQALIEAEEHPSVPFETFAARWLETVAPGLESGTVGRYRRILDRHLIPTFGRLDIRDPDAITPLAIARWITKLRDGTPAPDSLGDEPAWEREPLSPKSIRNLHGLLYAIMQAAVDAERPLRSHNPCAESGKHLPSLEDGEGDEEMVFLSPQEYAVIRGEFEDPQARDLTDWLYGTGLRFSEATALQVRDFDLMGRHPEFRVWRAWKQNAAGKWYLGTPKTKAALRPVTLTPGQVEAVLPRLAGRRREEFIFTGPSGGRWTHATYYACRWRPAVYRAARCVTCRGEDWAVGIGRRGYRDLRSDQIVWCGHEGMLEVTPRVHDLRHSHVAALISLGTPLLAISRRVGHKSIQITQDRYGHLLDEVHDDLVAGLDGLLARLGVAV